MPKKSEAEMKRINPLERTLRSLKMIFYIDIAKKKVIVTTDRANQGYKHNTKYEGNLEIPFYDLIEHVARIQREAEYTLDKDSTISHIETIGEFGAYEPDPLGFKRLARYLSRRMEQNA